MARLKKGSLILSGLSGQIGKTLIIKQYSYGTVVTKFPDMTGVKFSNRQKDEHNKFKEAVAFAREVLRDEKKRNTYEKKLKKGQNVYQRVISEYLKAKR